MFMIELNVVSSCMFTWLKMNLFFSCIFELYFFFFFECILPHFWCHSDKLHNSIHDTEMLYHNFYIMSDEFL